MSGTSRYLGYFAAKLKPPVPGDAAAIEHRGKFARLNFPNQSKSRRHIKMNTSQYDDHNQEYSADDTQPIDVGEFPITSMRSLSETR